MIGCHSPGRSLALNGLQHDNSPFPDICVVDLPKLIMMLVESGSRSSHVQAQLSNRHAVGKYAHKLAGLQGVPSHQGTSDGGQA